MSSRRDVLLLGAKMAAMAMLPAAAMAKPVHHEDDGKPAVVFRHHVGHCMAITQVMGDGLKLVAVALQFDRVLDAGRLDPAIFTVPGRHITKVYSHTEPTLSAVPHDGHYVIIELSPDDSSALLNRQVAGTREHKPAHATVVWAGALYTKTGPAYHADQLVFPTDKVINLVVDDFIQYEFVDRKTGNQLSYNLYIPKHYDSHKSYPLVLFMHDAGATSHVTNTTLLQGMGATAWASPAFQSRHEAFVLAPQYATQVVNDQSEANSYLDTTIRLIQALTQQYSIDHNRLYATGQSGGAMLAIAMNIRHPELFAASYLVAGQWDADKVAPLAHSKLWIMVSEGDEKAYPGENAITAALEAKGAKVSRAMWSGLATPHELAADVAAIEAENSPINYVVLKKGTVVPADQLDDSGSNHINTWRIAYTVDGILEWVFKQSKAPMVAAAVPEAASTVPSPSVRVSRH